MVLRVRRCGQEVPETSESAASNADLKGPRY